MGEHHRPLGYRACAANQPGRARATVLAQHDVRIERPRPALRSCLLGWRRRTRRVLHTGEPGPHRERALGPARGAGRGWPTPRPQRECDAVIEAISSNGTAKTSCSTNAIRSAGVSVSSTTSIASPTESASRVSCSGSPPSRGRTIRSGTEPSKGDSRLDFRARSMFSDTRATIVVNHRRFSTALASARLRRSHASWRASSASLSDPSSR